MISSNHLILCYPILLPSIFTSIRVFSNDLVLHIRWPKYWSISYRVSSLSEYSGLISFRMDWLISAFEGTLKSLLQHHSSKESILQCSVFFMVQHTSIYNSWKNQSFDYMDLCQQSMSLLFNMLSLFVIAFVPRSKRLLISWLQSPSSVILESKKTKSLTVSTASTYLPWSDGTRCHDLIFLNVEVLSQLFHSPLSVSSRSSLVPLCFLP